MRPLRYCPACGWVRDIPDPNNELHVCTYCHHELRDSVYGLEYYDAQGKELYKNESPWKVFIPSHRALFDKEIVNQPEFDPKLCKEREESAKLRAEYTVRQYQKTKAEAFKPKCPTCNSTNVVKISGTKRFVSVGVFGLASSNIGKTMECKNCGYKW